MTETAKKLLEKWRKCSENARKQVDYTKTAFTFQDGTNDARQMMYRYCADELAAALPAIEQEIRREALEDACKVRCIFCKATHAKAFYKDGHWWHYKEAPEPTLCEADEIRALAPSEPERKESK